MFAARSKEIVMAQAAMSLLTRLLTSAGRGTVVGTIAVACAATPLALAGAPAQASAAKSKADDKAKQADYPDVLLFKNGTTLACKVVSESAEKVHVKAKSSSGLTFETDYPKSDILKVTR